MAIGFPIDCQSGHAGRGHNAVAQAWNNPTQRSFAGRGVSSVIASWIIWLLGCCVRRSWDSAALNQQVVVISVPARRRVGYRAGRDIVAATLR